jgi:hypothetical protein
MPGSQYASDSAPVERRGRGGERNRQDAKDAKRESLSGDGIPLLGVLAV